MVSQSKLGICSAMLLGAAMAGGDLAGTRTAHNDPLEGIDLDAEYELIKQKKSRLSRAQREKIMSIVKYSQSQTKEQRGK